MHQKKSMRTVVITGNKLKKIFFSFVGIFVLTVSLIVPGMISKLPGLPERVGIKILSRYLNAEPVDVRKMGKLLLGFDVTDAKTILYKYYSLFWEIDNVLAVAESPPPETQETSATETQEQQAMPEYNIEAVNVSRGMEVSNLSGLAVDANALANEPLHIALEGGAPEVLIVHTHTTESFTDSGKTKYSASDTDRSTDSNKNMIAIGMVIKELLESEGIGVIHDTAVHDYPSYSGAYTRSMATVKNNLKKYPSIKVVLDIHRDGIVRDDGTKVKVVADIEGEKAAQCMFVVGSNATLTHDNWKDNMRLACKLQKYANENYPGLMRPIILRKERFNQQASNGAIIIEVGSNGNTLEEAKAGAKYMAKTICGTLKK